MSHSSQRTGPFVSYDRPNRDRAIPRGYDVVPATVGFKLWAASKFQRECIEGQLASLHRSGWH